MERALAPLVGLRMWGASRDADLLIMQFSEAVAGSGARNSGTYSLHVASAWRIAGPTSILVASGDLFTPSNPEAELETFDWDVRGASWWDARMEELARAQEAPPTVTTYLADSLGGFRLVCTAGIELEVFPNSSAAPHVETEFWRLVRPGLPDPHVVVGTSGIELVHQS